jgi:predicted peptidase
MRIEHLLLTVALVWSAAASGAPAKTEGITTMKNTENDKLTETATVSNLTELALPYRQLVFNAEKPGKFSLLLFLHGAGERGNDNERTKINAVGKITNYVLENHLKVVLLIPQCPKEQRWIGAPWDVMSHRMAPEPSKPLAAALALVDAKCAEFDVDPAQIRVCGISMGGYGTWETICRRPKFFAAAFAVCGGGDEEQAPKLKDMNIVVFHGAADPTVPVERSRNMVAAVRQAGNDQLLYVELPGVRHNSWEIAFGDRAAMDKFFATLRK